MNLIKNLKNVLKNKILEDYDEMSCQLSDSLKYAKHSDSCQSRLYYNKTGCNCGLDSWIRRTNNILRK